MKLGIQRNSTRREAETPPSHADDRLILPMLTAPSFDPDKLPAFDSAAALIGAMEIGVAVFCVEGNLIYHNPDFYRHTAIKADEFSIGSSIEDFCDQVCALLIPTPEEAAAQARIMAENSRRNMALGELIVEHRDLVTYDGRNLRVKRVYPGNGQIVLSCDDVTQTKRDSDYLTLGLELGSSGYWTLDFETGEFTFSDYILSRLSEGDITRIADNGLFAIVHKDDLPTIMGPWLKAIETGDKLDITYRVRTENDGEGWQRTVGRIIYEGPRKKKTFVGFVSDITDDMRLREDLSNAQAASLSKSESLARMSHEIKTPLNAIIGMTDSLSDLELDADIRDTLDQILIAADDLDETLSQTLSYSRITSDNETVMPEKVLIADIVQKLTEKWSGSCEHKKLNLHIQSHDSLPGAIRADGDKLLQILNALISNAIKFTPQGDIKVLLTRSGDDKLIFAVRDTGIGMDSAQRKGLFEPFNQADASRSRNYGGMGMGLSLTKALVDLLDGKIAVKSELGDGTTFMVTLPLTAQNSGDKAPKGKDETPTAPAQPSLDERQPQPTELPSLPTAPISAAPATQSVARSPVAAPPKRSISEMRVLCAEDNPVNQAVVRKLLGSTLGSLSFAEDGKAALDQLKTAKFDLILMDIHMPIKDGIETTLEIRSSEQDWSGIPIIALTADPDYQQARLCRNIGMNDAVAKPYRKADLIKAINQFCIAEAQTA